MDYKNGVPIIVTYQAVNKATGKTITMDVYDETYAKDDAKSIAVMTEIGATGRYYATFTPDAEGEWMVMMANTTDVNGEVVKAFAVAGFNANSIGDIVTDIQATLSDEYDGIGSIQAGIEDIQSSLSSLSSSGSPAMVG